jgi:hypothetical protein
MTVRTLLAGVAALAAVWILTGRLTDAGEKKQPDIEAYLKLGMPGEHHKHLNALVGTWHVRVKMWMDPSKSPSESEGTMTGKWILDGRFVELKYEGKFEGKQFTGIGLTGYDNIKKTYVSSWVDSMSSGIMTATGTYDAAKKAFTFAAEEFDPVVGAKVKMRDVLRVVDKDKLEQEMFKSVAQGKEFKMMEMTYTRKK